MITVLALGALGAVLSPQDPGKAPEPPCSDRTGMRWVLPFDDALAAAKQRRRLLLIKPIAFGTDKRGGW